MCGGPEQLDSNPSATSLPQESESLAKAMNNPIEPVVSEHSFSALLELVADNDVEGFYQSTVSDPCKVDEVGLWYVRQRASKRTVLSHRTPLMVASMYGSVEIVKLILSLSKEDINRSCDPDKSTALHCAASGGSAEAVEVIKLLLLAGADPNASDFFGNRPFDSIIASPPNLPNSKALKEMLRSEGSGFQADDLRTSPTWSPSTKKEYPIDPSIPDIRNSMYASDEFRMFSFKIRPCSRSYTHDWTECPFVHPGENARRRDPKKFHYSCVPCPDHRKAPCRRGDSCEYAHGVFESLLHPAQYRTRICKDGTNCARRVCFFAHKPEELRPLYLSTGSAVPSSPRSVTPPMSPQNGISQGSIPWPHQNIPTLHLPGNHLQIRRLRSTLNSRDVQMSLSEFPSSPRYSDQIISSPSQKSMFVNQHSLSPRNIDHLLSQPPFQGIEPLSPLRSRPTGFANQHQLRCPGSWDLGSNLSHDVPCDLGSSEFASSPVSCWSQWESPIGKVDWSVKADELGRLRKSFSIGNNVTEPQVSSVQSLLKESNPDIMAMTSLTISGEALSMIKCSNPKQIDQVVALA